MADKLIRYEVQDGVAILTMDDPPANTYTHEMMRDLDDAIVQARFDESVHVIVIRGAGEKFFSAGANIQMLRTSDPYFKYYFCLHANETLNRLEQTPKLVIGALNGHRLTSGSPILPPPCRASRMSHASAISRPPPTVYPLSAPITSLGVCSSRLSVSFACRQK